MTRPSAGRLTGDPLIHVLADTLPPAAICGAGVVTTRAGGWTYDDDPEACPVCLTLLRRWSMQEKLPRN